MKVRVQLLFGVFLFFAGALAKSQNTQALHNEINVMEKDACFRQASWSVCVMDISSGKLVVSHNAEKVLEPASVMKIITTGAALSLLGKDFTFKTKVEYSGFVDKGGVLHGNLYITGSGDPTTGSERFGKKYSLDTIFENFYKAVQRNNIKKIRGKLVADASCFGLNPLSYGWAWEDIGNYYAGGAWGINLFENKYTLYFDAGKNVGDAAALIKMYPYIADLQFTNTVKTGNSGSGDNAVIIGSPFSDKKIIEGTIPFGKKNYDVDGSISNPPELFAELFYNFLSSKGIQVDSLFSSEFETGKKSDTSSRKVIFVHESPKLSDIVYYTNLKSVNLFAESILKITGLQINGKGGYSEGIEVITEFWRKKDIDLSGFFMHDGCGLSRKNKLSTYQIVSILAKIINEKTFPQFEKSLPLAGVSGGLSNMLKGSVAENNLKAKTGNMDKIKSYAGYVKNVSGNELCFAIIFNNYTCSNSEVKAKAEKLMLLIAQTK